MPKESKKFINPLLRPSQEVEVKGDSLTRLQKSLVSESPFLENVEVVEETEAPRVERISSEQEPTPQPIKTPTETYTSPYPATRTLSNSLEPTREKSFQEGEKRSAIARDQGSTTYVNDNAPLPVSADNQREDFYSAPKSNTMLSPTSLSYNRETFTEPLPPPTSTVTSTSTSTDTSTNPHLFVQTVRPIAQIDQEQEERQVRPSFRAEESVRRKKGPLAFEKTHERITLWIDKGLKQAFEDLALERELPKTALLNEAVADLLRKYDR